MSSDPFFQGLAPSDTRALTTLADTADFHQRQAFVTMEMDMNLNDSVPRSHFTLPEDNALDNGPSETEVDPSQPPITQILINLQRQIEDLEEEMKMQKQRAERNQMSIRRWCEQMARRVQEHRKKPGKKSPAASDM